METIQILKNVVQEYAWGSFTAIPDLLGQKTISSKPQAELWIGAHPKAPSRVQINGKWESLIDLIEKNPKDILGKKAADHFNNKLPYLFKILAAEKPLSIQAHPDLLQAKNGFEKENNLNIALNAYNRSYKDKNHKPECICALTSFWALNGFRKINDIIMLMEKICPKEITKQLYDLKQNPDSHGLKTFFNFIMTVNENNLHKLVDGAITNAKKYSKDDPAYEWMIKLYNEYLVDVGIFSPILLNLVCLIPGQAMYLSPGQLHAYLKGVGIELMANSDNVVRGGLTKKHIDLKELMSIVNFNETKIKILEPAKQTDSESVYLCPAKEFVLSVINVTKQILYISKTERNVEIIICIKGNANICDPGSNFSFPIQKGTSLIIPASIEKYTIEGNATLYKASV